MMHMSNTSGILNYPEAHFDMVRLGLGLYGFSNDPELNSNEIVEICENISNKEDADGEQFVNF